MEYVLSICLGIGLAAACGFRIFLPMLIASMAARAGVMPLSEGFQWAASDAAVTTFLAATLIEIAGYYVPWLDNLLDSLGTPAAMAAGGLIAAAAMSGVPPLVKWTLVVIAGGGGGTIKAGLAGVRLGATATTGGAANWLVATLEWLGSLVMSLFAVFLPVLAAVLALLLLVFLIRLYRRSFRSWRRSSAEGPAA